MPNTTRSRTPPDVKWLLNERAALAGAHARAVARQLALIEKRGRLEQEISRLQQQIEGAVVSATRTKASLDALDATMGLIDTRLEPTAAGEVNAWAGKYGKHGALGAFVEVVLRDASPEPLGPLKIAGLMSSLVGMRLGLLAAYSFETAYRSRWRRPTRR